MVSTLDSRRYWLYTGHPDLDSIFSAIRAAKLPPSFEIKSFLLISNVDLLDEMRKWCPKRFSIENLTTNSKVTTIQLTKIKRNKDQISGKFNLVKLGQTQVYMVLSYESLEFVRCVLEYFDAYYSSTSRLSITSDQIKLILDRIKEDTKGEIITDRFVAYSRIKEKQKERILSSRKFPEPKLPTVQRMRESDLRWTNEDYSSSFKKAAENNQWIDKINFSVKKDFDEIFFGSLSRSGLIKCNKNPAPFFKIILEILPKLGSDKIKIFKDKERQKNNGDIRPISIEYDTNIFKDVEQNHRLVNVLSELPKSSYSVYHGNPYLHVSLVDYRDGSAYDIWVLSDNRITIVPQLKASFSSISRLCEHIMRRFREGEIKELKVN